MASASHLGGDEMSDLHMKSVHTVSKRFESKESWQGSDVKKVLLTLFTAIVLGYCSPALEAQSDPVPPAAPTNLECIVEVAHLELSWTNTGEYDQILIRRNGVLLEYLNGSSTSYLDMDVPANFHLYSVHGMTTGANGQAEGLGAECSVFLIPPPIEPGLEVPAALNFLPVPLPDNLFDFIADPEMAIALGKAFFWDMQAGSDDQIACATCHYHAGADNRRTHQLYNGHNEVFDLTVANERLTAADFPLHKLANPNDHTSAVIQSVDDTVGSSGILHSNFLSLTEDANGVVDEEIVSIPNADSIKVNSDGSSVQMRNVTDRNAPTVINSIYFLETFWDGRASFWFNGRDNWGPRNPDAFVYKVQPDGTVTEEKILLDKASLASQAAGPIMSGNEMSAHGRDLYKVGKKLLSREPLATQRVHPNDSVLGGMSDATDGKGLGETTYQELIQSAFVTSWWASDQLFEHGTDANGNLLADLQPIIDADGNLVTGVPNGVDQFSMMEANFSLYWGLAIMMYESTLISEDSRYDQWWRATRNPADPNGDLNALTALEHEGMSVLANSTCMFCHTTSLWSSAGTSKILTVLEPEASEIEALLERMPMRDMQLSVYDGGFYNLGVTPTGEDIGRGGIDPFGHSFSIVKTFQEKAHIPNLDADNDGIPNGADPDFVFHDFQPFADHVLVVTPPPAPWEDTNMDGMFKTPTLRNVELTGPYFHNGGAGTLEQVVNFYARGGNFVDQNLDTLAPEMIPQPFLSINEQRKLAMVAFMESLTDDRVRWEKAPFDHPEIRVPEGALASDLNGDVIAGTNTVAIDRFKTVPAVGAEGRSVETDSAGRPLDPLVKFLQPRTVKDLSCVQDGESITMSWLPQEFPDDASTSFKILRNNQVVAVLPETAASFTDTSIPPGEHQYTVRGEDAHEGFSAHCTVLVNPPAPLDLTSNVNVNQVSLQWTNPWPYHSIDIFRDGVKVGDQLAGTTEIFVDGGVPAGHHSYEVVGRILSIVSGNLIFSEPAIVGADRHPLAAQILGCTSVAMGQNEVTWGNSELYDSLSLLRNGTLISELDGQASSYLDTTSLPGESNYSLIATVSGLDSAEAGCLVQRAPLPVESLNCDNNGGIAVLSWVNPEPWEQAEIYRDGQLINILTQIQNSYQDDFLTNSGSGLHNYVIKTYFDGLTSGENSCGILVAPTPVVLFECEPLTGGVLLSWTNTDTYDQIQIMRGSELLVNLGGGSTQTFDSQVASGAVIYTLTASKDNVSASSVQCMATIPSAPILDLTCSDNAGGVQLSWTNSGDYTTIDVLRNGSLIDTVLGASTSYLDNAATGGISLYQVVPSSNGVVSDNSNTCAGSMAPLPITGLQGQLIENCQGDVLLSWNNAEAYDSIRLERNGIPMVTLPGSQTETTIDMGVHGIHELTLVPAMDNIEGPAASTSIDFVAEVVSAPIGFSGSVDVDTCQATLSWTNQGTYSQIQIVSAGEVLSTLAGGVSSTVVALPGAGGYVLELVVIGECGTQESSADSVALDCSVRFLRGDQNGDGSLDISDPLSLLGFMFGVGEVTCEDASDANDDGNLDVSDAVRMLQYLFGGASMPAPINGCGVDPTADGLGCEQGDPSCS